MPTFDSIRQQAPWMQDWSDEEVMLKLSELTNTPLTEVAKDFGIKLGSERSALGAGLASGWESLKGLGYSGAAAVADVVGAEGAKDWLERQAFAKEVQSAIASRPELEKIEEQTFGSALPYVGYQVAKQAPNIIGAIAAGAIVPEVAVPAALSRGAAILPRALGGGGLGSRVAAEVAAGGTGYAAKRAALETGQTFGKQVVGGLAFNEAQSVGSLYQAAREGGDENAGAKALAGSPLYALSETLPEAMLVGRFKGGSGFTGNLLTRMGKAAGVQGISGATSEGLQNEMEMALNPNLTPEQQFSNRLNSVAAGGIVEGLLGGFGGMAKGSRLPSGGSLMNGATATDQPATSQTPDDRGTNTAIDASSSSPSVLGTAQAAEIDQKKLATFTAQAQADQQAQLDQAKAEADAQAQQQAQIQAMQQQEQRNAALSAFGVTYTSPNQSTATFMGQPIAGTGRINALADELNKVVSGMPEQKILLARALMSADTNTSAGKLRYKVDGANTPKTVQNAMSVLDKVQQQYMIDEAADMEEVANILDVQSQTAKGKELEFINAVYEAITGKNTTGYEQSQGATNGKLQTTTGLGTVPKQGGASQATGGELGLLQPGGIQPVAAGSVAGGPSAVQTDTGREGGARAGAGIAPAASVSGSTIAQAPQVTGVHRGQQAGTQGAIATAPQGTRQTSEAGRVEAAGEGTETNLPGQAEGFLNELVDTVVQRAGKMKAEHLQKYRDLIKMYMMADKNTVDYSEAAHYFGITVEQAERWSKDARNFSTKWAKPLAKVLPELMEKYNVDREQLLTLISAERQQAEKTLIEEVGGARAAVDERDLGMLTEEGAETGGDLKTKTTKQNLSKQERFNKAENLNARYIRLTEEIENIQEQLDSGEVTGEELTALEEAKAEAEKKLEETTQQLVETEKKRVAKSAAEKGDKNAVQEPSATEVPLRKRAGGGEGVRQKDTGKRKAAKEVVKVEAKPEEKVDPEQKWDIVAAQYGLPVFVDLPGAAQADVITHKGAMTLAFANEVYENNKTAIEQVQKVSRARQAKLTRGRTIEGEVVQREVVQEGMKALPTPQVEALEKHYGVKSGTEEFLSKVRDDVIKYVTQGAEAVSAKIRHIIKEIANGVLSIAVVFNPLMVTPPQQIAVPVYDTQTTQVVAEVPAEAKSKMSEAAQRAYATILPAIQADLKKNDKLFIVTDKPTATNFIFTPDGKLLFQSKVLVGKAVGDFYKGNNAIEANRVTPAGLYNLGLREGGKTAAGYDFNKVFGLEQEENGQKYFITIMHSVWTHEKDAAQRQAALKKEGAADSRYSFGCINVDKDTYGKILQGHEKQMNGAKIFIVPDSQENVMEFVNGKAVKASDMVREGVTPVTKEVKTPLKNIQTASTERTVAGKEEQYFKGQAPAVTHSIVDADQTDLEDMAARFSAVQNVVDKFEKLGISKALDAAQVWATTDDVTFTSDGVYEVLPGGWQGVMFHEDSIDPDIDPDAELNVAHEMAHAIDMAGHGGIYSNQIEMAVSAKDGKIRPIGVVMQEMHKLYETVEGWNKYLEYPFNHTAYPKLANNAERIRTELFAQLFSAYTDPTLREAMRISAPVTYKYMTEVFENVKSTKSFFGKTEAAATNRRQAYANRYSEGGAQGGQAPGDGGRDESRQAPQTYDKISKRTQQWVGQSKGFIDNLPTWARGPVRTIHNVLFGGKETALGLMITEDIAEMAKKFMKSVTKYVEVQHLRNSLIATKERRLTSIKTAFEDLDTNTRRAVNNLISDMTINGKWAFDPQLEGVKPENIDEALKNRFNALPAGAQKVVKEVFAVGRESLQEKKDTIRKIIDDEFNERSAAATTEAEKADVIRRKTAMEKQFAGILKINPNTPYAPLKRFGSFVVVAKSQAYLDAEAANDKKEMRKLQSDESHYVVEFAETAGEAEQIYDALNAMGGYKISAPFKKSTARDSLYRGTDLYKGFAKLKRVLAAEKGVEASLRTKDAELLGRLETMVNDLYLLSLADSSARKSEMERKKIAGFNRDMMRAFFTQGMADAHYIANLKTADQSMDVMVQMQKEAGENRAQAYPYLNEIMAREAQALEVREPSLGDAMNRMAGDWFLTFSPSFYFQQLTQTYVLSLPWLAGKYNYFKSERALRQAYKQILPLIKGTGLKEHMDFSKAPEDVREMLKVLVGRGRIDIGVEAELGGFRSEATNPMSEAYNSAANRLRGAINRIEALNRSVAAIAAYRLEMQKSGDKTKAIEAADKVVHVTHGSYDGFNTPRLFNKNAVTRSLTQFRRFQIIQLSMLARMVHNAFKGANKTERAMGRKQLAFLLGHTFALGGVKGMPIYVPAALAYSLITGAFGDEDDPEDFEAWLRSQGGLLLARGIPANMGVDLSGKLGMGNVLSVLPYTDVDLSSKQGYANLLLGASGPFLGGLVPKMIDGVNLVAGGDYYRGLEQMLPNGLNNGIKVLRFNTEGITMRNGDVVMAPEEIGFADSMFQLAGLPTATMTERQYTQGQVIKFDQFYGERAKEVKKDYIRAYKDNDPAAMAEARDAWNNLQESRVKYGYTRKPLSELIKAPREQAKRERSVVGGVETTKSNKAFVQRLSEE